MSNGNPNQKRRSRHKADIEPITLDELLSGAGMSGFLGILDRPVAVPHLQKLVDEIRVDTQDTVSSQGTERFQDTVASQAWVPSKDTVSCQDTESSYATVAVPDTVSPEATALQPHTVLPHDTVARQDTVSPHATPGHAKVRHAKSVQDGHTKAEQLLYAAMWTASRPEHSALDAPRILTGGYDQLSALSGLYWSAVKRNLHSLQAKLAIETIASENSNERVGRTYRIHSASAILERRRNAGLTLVRRWRGSVELLSEDTVSSTATVSRNLT